MMLMGLGNSQLNSKLAKQTKNLNFKFKTLMFNKYKKQFLFLLVLFTIIALPIMTNALTLNQKYPKIGGVDLNCVVNGGCDLSVGIIVIFLYNSAIWIGGIVAFISLVYVGFLYIFSGNAPGNRSKAKGMLNNVIWGISILLLSYVTLVLINPDLVKLPETFLPTVKEGNTNFNIGNVENKLSGCDEFNENISICVADNYPNVELCASCCFAKSDTSGKEACQTNFLDAFIPQCFTTYENAGFANSAQSLCQNDCEKALVSAVGLGLNPVNACARAIANYVGENQGEGNPGIDPTEFVALKNICTSAGNTCNGIIYSPDGKKYMECFLGASLEAPDNWCASCTDTFGGQECIFPNGSDNPAYRACGYLDASIPNDSC